MSPAGYAEELISRLRTNFDSSFLAIKTQKLISTSRNSTRVRSIAETILVASRSMPISGKKRSLLRRHCETTVFFQDIFAGLQAKTSNLTIWELSFEELSRSLLLAIEELSFDQSFAQAGEPPAHASSEVLMNRMEMENIRLRNRCDFANLVINEGRSRCTGARQGEPTPEETQSALLIAQETDRARSLWDLYTFRSIGTTVKENLLIFGDRSPSEVARDEIHSRRININDLDTNHSFESQFNGLRRKYTEELQSTLPPTLEAFLRSPEGNDVLDSFDTATEDFLNEIATRLDHVIDVGESLVLPAGTFTYVELARFWALLYRLSFVFQIWSASKARDERKLLSPVISVAAFEEFAAQGTGETVPKIRKYMKLFASTPKNRIDLFYKPLLMLGADRILLASSIVQISRFDRNLLRMLTDDTSHDISSKGRRPLVRLGSQFKEAGFSYKSDIAVVKDGTLVTDADILAAKDNVLFIMQSKILSVSDDLYEEWRNQQCLELAAVQMEICIDNLASILKAHGESLGVTADCDIAPYLVTNIWNFTGDVVNRYRVTDLSYLGNLLKGGAVRIKKTGSGDEVAIFRLIEGSRPTAMELERLLNNPPHGRFLGVKGSYRRHSVVFDEMEIRLTTRYLSSI
jgi:hypothetical protein